MSNTLEEESYFVDIYIDTCNDTVAFETRYRFTTEELVKDFCKKVCELKCLCISLHR